MKVLTKILALFLLASPLAAQTADTVISTQPRAVIDSVRDSMPVPYTAYRDSFFYRLFVDTLIDTVYTITIRPAPPPTMASCKNEPTNFTRFSSQDFNALPPQSPAKDSTGWFFGLNRFRVSTTNGIATGLFPAGMTGGRAPFRINLNLPVNTSALYVCYRAMFDSNWTDNGNAGTKSMYAWTAYSSGDYRIHTYLNMSNNLGVNTTSPQGNTTIKGPPMPKGRWVEMQVILDGNGGIVQEWMDGVQTINRSGVRLFNPGQVPRYTQFTWDPTYGGGTHPVPYDMRVRLDYLYVSGR